MRKSLRHLHDATVLLAIILTMLCLAACGGSGDTLAGGAAASTGQPGDGTTPNPTGPAGPATNCNPSCDPVTPAADASEPPYTGSPALPACLPGTTPSLAAASCACPPADVGAGGICVIPVPPTPPPANPAPTMSLTASPSTVTPGAYVLTWSSTGATFCEGSPWPSTASEELAPSGFVTTPVLTAATSYGLTCNGAGGNATSSVTLPGPAPTQTPPPSSGPPGTSPAPTGPLTMTLTAFPASIAPDQTSTITWTSNGTYCGALSDWPGAGTMPASGSVVTPYLVASVTYVLACFTDKASVEASVTVTVVAPLPVLTVALAVDPVSVADDGASYATLTVTPASSVAGDVITCTPFNGAPIGPFNSFQLGPQIITATCRDPAGASASASITLTVTPAAAPPADTFTGVLSGNVETLTWSTYSGEVCAVDQANDNTGGVVTLAPVGPSGSATSGFLSTGTPYTFTLECSGQADSAVPTITVQP